ncbi:hypothetical protein EU803_09790 [Loktanella sp. IMCC34160]|uniref:hypothetical protein n=1 Tax=Loktanella sp. IMCC34160 TaxID=2510646 RepID=UPI00101B6C56|nr:hypothetical protein [Loktanella sp. IMCC34160]RYG91374.1 hypothetical protein EU803_09790 [Loktanella sp. IMCC34160]
MSQARKIAMAGGTFAVALGIGFVMQNGDALASRFGSASDLPPPIPVEAPQVETVAVVEPAIEEPAPSEAMIEPVLGSAMAMPEPELSAPETVEAPLQLAAVEMDAPAIAPDVQAPLVAPVEQQAEVDCTPSMFAQSGASAMVSIDIDAPCHPSARFTVHHQGMMFTDVTDGEGLAHVDVPALAEMSVFIAAFPGGDGAVATVTVPDVSEYDRAVLLWQGDSGLQIHAREFGAEYGSKGHVWNGAPRSPEAAEMGGGFLVRLGKDTLENPMMAEIYTFPTGAAPQSGQVILSVEAEITAGNCARDVAAQSIQIAPDMETNALDLSLTMPPCDTVGDFLVLSTMLNDLTIASR